MFADSIEEARLMVVQNNGFMPVDAGPEFIGNATTRIPLYRKDSPITRHYCAFWKKENSGYYIECFAEMLEAVFSEQNN